MDDVTSGDGWAVTDIASLGDGPGFRKIRSKLGITAFGMNAIVLPPGIETGRHFHDRQQEVYFVHAGRVEMEFGDGGRQLLEPGGIARVDPSTVRKVRNVGDVDAVYVIVGGADGYVGRDGHVPEGEEERYRATT
jgi:mannose-6-phosphate isomerase-like protein (cupin superfamily)